MKKYLVNIFQNKVTIYRTSKTQHIPLGLKGHNTEDREAKIETHTNSLFGLVNYNIITINFHHNFFCYNFFPIYYSNSEEDKTNQSS